jgi:hypothetical protein
LSRLEPLASRGVAVFVIALLTFLAVIDGRPAAPQPKSEGGIGAAGLGRSPVATSRPGLPGSWPSDFPLPPGARAVHSVTEQTPRGPTMGVWFEVPGGADEGFFRYALRSKEWSIVPTISTGRARPIGDGRVILAVGHGWAAGLIFGRIGQARWYDGRYDFYVYLFPGNR